MNFFSALTQHAFLQHALLGTLLASLACGVIGSFVVVRRISYLAGGIAHAVLGGMGLAFFLGHSPINGALIGALVIAVIIAAISDSERLNQHEDTVISAMWAAGMSIGIIFISRTPAYNIDLISYLFGNVLMIADHDLWRIALLDSVILTFTTVCYRQLLVLCYDREFAGLRGVRVRLLNTLLLCMIAITVVILIQIVGLILVIALLTLPAATARLYAPTMLVMMALATLFTAVISSGGLIIAFSYDLPTGATTALLAALLYLLALALRRQ